MEEEFLYDPFIEKMANIILWLSGKKTYLLMALGVVYALSGYITGYLDFNTAFEIGLGSLGLGTLRAGISKI